MKNGFTFENCERAIRRLVLNEYAAKFKFSKRECEILETMVAGSTNTSELSKHLGISPNTSNNHLKRMMDKTGNSSKIDMVAKFYQFMTNRLAFAYLFSKRPKVLIVDDEADFSQMLAEDLSRRGMHTFCETNPENASKRVSEIYPDFILLDIYMPRIDGLALLRQIREQLPHEPFVIIISGRSPEEEVLLNDGAAAVFNKPVDTDDLFNTIIDLYSDPPIQGLRLTRVSTSLKTHIEKLDIDTRVQNLGYGGAFLKIPNTRNDIWSKVSVGQRIIVPLKIGGHTFEINCKVVWARKQKNAEGGPGIGVKFESATPEELKEIRKYVREHRLKAFVPLN